MNSHNLGIQDSLRLIEGKLIITLGNEGEGSGKAEIKYFTLS